MARTNTPIQRTALRTHEGAAAHRINPLQELRRSLMACLLWENTFYEDGEAVADRIAELVKSCKPEDVAALAVEARTQQHLRHAPLWLLHGLFQRPEGRRAAGQTLAQVIQRPDELAEFLALYWKDGRKPLAAQVKKGLAAAFQKFNAYSLAKYNRDGAVKLRDVLFMVHAKPKDEAQAAIWKQLVDGTLAPADTWEVALSAGKDKKETWERLIAEGQLGGFALLRNLRNMQEANVPEAVIRGALTTMRTDRILPFRFIAAAKYGPMFEPELEAAMFKNLAEMPKLKGKTMLLVDHSGSMNVPLSGKSDLTRFEAACGLAMLLREVCESVAVMAYSDQGMIVGPRRGFALRDALANAIGWGGTYTETAKQAADKIGYDRCIIVTDEQSHESLTAPKGLGYVVNVGTYKNGIGYGKWTHVDGWSEAIVSYITAAESEAK